MRMQDEDAFVALTPRPSLVLLRSYPMTRTLAAAVARCAGRVHAAADDEARP